MKERNHFQLYSGFLIGEGVLGSHQQCWFLASGITVGGAIESNWCQLFSLRPLYNFFKYEWMLQKQKLFSKLRFVSKILWCKLFFNCSPNNNNTFWKWDFSGAVSWENSICYKVRILAEHSTKIIFPHSVLFFGHRGQWQWSGITLSRLREL